VARKVSHATVWLDYGSAGRKAKFLPNLSAVAVADSYLWTATDEMRTIECLAPYRGGYRLHRQFSLDALFPGLPGADSQQEADIEALDVAEGRLWICGSHSRTRRSQIKTREDHVEAQIHKRPSRRLFGSLRLSDHGCEVIAPGQALAYKGEGSLRAVLGNKPHLAPFMELPSKENGLDIEGLTIFRKKIYVGLRGPVIDNVAMIAAIERGENFTLDEHGLFLHFVDLGGLGVRDLTRWKGAILILAGPVSSADGPFKLFRWTPRRTVKIQKPDEMPGFPTGPDHPFC
jgi:hypothetical protein